MADMAVLTVLKYPHPLLRTRCSPVESFDPALGKLVDDMVETMRHHEGCVGLAAPQIGSELRVFVMDVSRKLGPKKNHGLLALVNPVIEYREGEKVAREGCLSIPEFLGDVKRSRRIIVKARDHEGNELEIPAKGLESVAIQHELDHLDGILFIDRVTMLGRDLVRRKGR